MRLGFSRLSYEKESVRLDILQNRRATPAALAFRSARIKKKIMAQVQQEKELMTPLKLAIFPKFTEVSSTED
jgi:hypothetical protein